MKVSFRHERMGGVRALIDLNIVNYSRVNAYCIPLNFRVVIFFSYYFVLHLTTDEGFVQR